MERETLQQLIKSFTPEQINHAKTKLQRWNELDTWPTNQALMLMVGIDPHRADDLVWTETGMTSLPSPTWAHLAIEPSVSFNAAGVPQIAGYTLCPAQIEVLARLIQLWGSGASPNLLSRHPPAYFREWATSKGFDTFLSLATPAPAQDTVPPATVEPASDGPAPAVPNWKMRIQAEATELVKRLRKSGAQPTKHSILESMAEWCVNNKVKTDGEIYPSVGYLRTHVLGGQHWDVPN